MEGWIEGLLECWMNGRRIRKRFFATLRMTTPASYRGTPFVKGDYEENDRNGRMTSAR
jgi:hypothetical protein